MNKAIFFWVLTAVSIDAMASGPKAFQSINQSATVDNVAANSQAFLGNLFEFFVNLGLVAGVIVGFTAGLKMKKISSGEEQGSYAGPLVMLAVAGGLTSVWFVVFVLSNTVENLSG